MTEDFGSCRLDFGRDAARLTLTRPPLHVLDIAAIDGVARALETVARSEASVLILSSEGYRAFSAGVEVRDHFPERLDDMLDAFHGICRRLLSLDAVTVAAVRGSALGGGMELLACCDFVLASESAVFAQPEIDLACFPPLGAALYPHLIGPKRATELVLLGERLTAREALSLGLVTGIVADEELEGAVSELVSKLASKSPAALRVAKKALRVASEHALESLPEIELLYREELAATEDMVEGLRAFLEKRKPVWKGN